MKFPVLKMESQLAQIGIRQNMANIEIKQPKAELEIEQPKAVMHLKTVKGKLTIDQTQAWEETNLKSTGKWAEEFASDGKSAAKAGTARRAEQGAALLNIHQSGEIISQQAIQNGHPQMKELSIKYIPSPFAVKLAYQPAKLEIDVQPQAPRIQAHARDVEMNASVGSVDIYMERFADITIEVDMKG